MTKRESLDETPSPDGNGILFYFFCGSRDLENKTLKKIKKI